MAAFGAASYDTKLSPAEEAKFKAWKKRYAPNDSGEDYDLRGAFKAGLTPDPETGHWPDTYKKPNEPTFSNESQYARIPYKGAATAGHWEGENRDQYVKAEPMAAPTRKKKGFDLAGARNEGYSDTEIADYLAEDRKFDLKGARKEGYSDTEIAEHLATMDTLPKGTPKGASQVIPSAILKGAEDTVAGVGTLGEMLFNPGKAIAAKIMGRENKSLGQGAEDAIDPYVNDASEVVTGVRPLYHSRDDLRPQDRPYATGGEAVGGSLVPGMGVLGAAKAGARPVAKIFGHDVLGDIFNFAAEHPRSFATAEGASAVGSGVGGAVANQVDPDNTALEVGGEIVGGIASPLTIGGRTLRGAKTVINRTRGYFSRSAREDEAAKAVQAVTKLSGANPEDVAAKLDLVKEPGTSGPLSGNSFLATWEKRIARDNPAFNNRKAAQEAETFSALRESADVMGGSGDPQLVKIAANMRAVYFDKMLQGRVDRAMQKVTEANGRLGTDGVTAQQEASQAAYSALGDALDEARTAERAIWGQVSHNVPIRPQATAQALAEVHSQLLPNEKLPGAVGAYLRRGIGERTTSGELIRLRSRLLEEGRRLMSGANPDRGMAQRVFKVANGVLDDLGQAGNELTVARQFSDSLNDVFTRSVVGKVTAKEGTGGLREAPETLLDRALTGRHALPEQRLEELRDAASFGDRAPIRAQAATSPSWEHNLPALNEFYDRVAGAEEQYLRGAAQQLIDPQTGRVTEKRLQQFVASNGKALAEFPSLRADLGSVEGAEQAIKNVLNKNAHLASVRKEAAFGALLKNENPVAVIGQAIHGKTPVADYRSLASTARKAGTPDGAENSALDGLRIGTLRHSLEAATSKETGRIDFEELNRRLFNPLGDGVPSTIELMQKNGVLKTGQLERIKAVVERGIEVQRAIKADPALEDVIALRDGLGDALVRSVGAKAGGLFHKALGGGGGGLIAAAAGAKQARRLLEKVPNIRTQKVIIEAFDNPKFMAMLLRRPVGNKARAEWAKQINGFLFQAGFTNDPGDQDEGDQINRQMRYSENPQHPNVPQFGTPQDQRSHLTPAQQDNFARLKKYFDPKSDAGFPLARLGAMASDGNIVERWQTAVNLQGMTTTGDHGKETTRDPLLGQIFKEAGYDPKTVGPGQIAVGPQFDKEVNLTLEHEMMHRAIQAYFPNVLGPTDEEVLIRTITATPEDKEWVNSEIQGGWDNAVRVFAPKREKLERLARDRIKQLRKAGSQP